MPQLLRSIGQRLIGALPRHENPPHFHDVLFALSDARSAYPALRVGQLIDNVMATELNGKDLFYVTNQDLADAIRRFITSF